MVIANLLNQQGQHGANGQLLTALLATRPIDSALQTAPLTTIPRVTNESVPLTHRKRPLSFNVRSDVSPIPSKRTSATGRPIKGPQGCNVFVNFLPSSFSDDDLYDLFCPYGIVLSTKVFFDRVTNRSKCFGFVSYDNRSAADAAIRSLHNCVVCNKKLDVEFKK
ncbi:hypothetical protein ACOME3_007869, partial [Neoechinorhynchus agilis]